MTNDDCYVCDRCGDEYFFENSYDQTQWPSGEIEYFINGWHGLCDGQEMCDKCWDAY